MSRFRRRRKPFRLARRRGLKTLTRARRTRFKLNTRVRTLELAIENKVHDISQQFSPGTTGSIKFLTGIAPGTSENQRIGKKIMSVHIQGSINITKSPLNNNIDRVRIMLIRDRQYTGVVPAITKILKTSVAQSLRTQTNFPRFDILRDWKITLPVDGDGPGVRWIRVFKKLGGKRGMINYIFTDATAASGGMGTLLLLMLANENVDKTVIDVDLRLTYKDA